MKVYPESIFEVTMCYLLVQTVRIVA